MNPGHSNLVLRSFGTRAEVGSEPSSRNRVRQQARPLGTPSNTEQKLTSSVANPHGKWHPQSQIPCITGQWLWPTLCKKPQVQSWVQPFHHWTCRVQSRNLYQFLVCLFGAYPPFDKSHAGCSANCTCELLKTCSFSK